MSEEIPSSESAEENKIPNELESEIKKPAAQAKKFQSNFSNGKFEKKITNWDLSGKTSRELRKIAREHEQNIIKSERVHANLSAKVDHHNGIIANLRGNLAQVRTKVEQQTAKQKSTAPTKPKRMEDLSPEEQLQIVLQLSAMEASGQPPSSQPSAPQIPQNPEYASNFDPEPKTNLSQVTVNDEML